MGHLLRMMQRRAKSHKVSNEILMELFFSHLPSSEWSILPLIIPLTLDKVEDTADQILRYNSAAVHTISVPSNINSKLLCEY